MLGRATELFKAVPPLNNQTASSGVRRVSLTQRPPQAKAISSASMSSGQLFRRDLGLPGFYVDEIFFGGLLNVGGCHLA